MSSVPVILDENSRRLGLLMETAHSQQQTIDQCLERLTTHSHGLDEAIGDAIGRATERMCRENRAAALRVAWLSGAVGALPNVLVAMLLAWALPSPERLSALQIERERLTVAIARLAASGGRIDLRRCGERERLCVRVDRAAPSYGVQADYLIVRGY